MTQKNQNPAGMTSKQAETFFDKMAREWVGGRDYYRQNTRAPELHFIHFLRWGVVHWPAVRVTWLSAYDSLRWKIDPTAEGAHVESLTHAEALATFPRLDVGASPPIDERGLLSALGPAFAEDFAPFRAIYREALRAGRWPAEACRTLFLVDWLQGAELSPDELRAVGRFCALEHQRGGGVTSDLAPLDRRGVVTGQLRDVARAVLGDEGWRAALGALIDAPDSDWWLSDMFDYFDGAPLAPNAARLANRTGFSTPARLEREAWAYLELAKRRREPTTELLRISDSIQGTRLSEVLRLEVIARSLEAGERLPRPAASLLGLDLEDRLTILRYRDVLVRLPKAERDSLDKRGVGIVAIADEDDDTPLRIALEFPNFNVFAVGRLGKRAADAIVARLEEPCSAELRGRLELALLEAIATHVAGGGALDSSMSFYLVLANMGLDAVKTTFKHLPEPTRSDLFVEAVAENPKPMTVVGLVSMTDLRPEVAPAFIAALRKRTPERYPGSLPPALASLCEEPGGADRGAPHDLFTPRVERIRALAATAPGPHETVYLLEIVDEDRARPATTLTAFGGRAPGARRPSSRMRHVLTIDARDVPEIAARFRGARAASLFVPREIEDDDDPSYEGSFWRGFSEQDVADALTRVKLFKQTLIAHRVSLPTAVFSKESGAAAKLRDEISFFHGYLFGAPLPLQPDTGATRTDDFMAQLRDSFELVLGDAGCLYSYVNGALWDCH